jgi:lipopolysaccharide biosynthesis glycosyltransferase
MQAAVMLHSTLSNIGAETPEVHVYFVDTGIEPESKQRLVSVINRLPASLHWIPPRTELVADLHVPEWQHISAYAKFFIPTYIEQETSHPRVLYLDADIIVEGDVSTLWKEDLDGNAIGAVQSYEEPTVSDRDPRSSAYYTHLGYEHNTPLFNSGVLLLDIKNRNWEDLVDGMISARRLAGDNLALSDQDCWNLVFRDNWKQLDPSWNLCYYIGNGNSAEKIRAIREADAHIIHYLGGDVNITNPYCAHPARKRFLHYLRRSGWFSATEFSVWYARQQILRGAYTLRVKLRSQVARYISRIRRALPNDLVTDRK